MHGEMNGMTSDVAVLTSSLSKRFWDTRSLALNLEMVDT